MKGLLIFASIVALTSAGTPEVNEIIELEAMQLYDRHCNNGGNTGDQPGYEEGTQTYVFCKPSKDIIKIPQVHETQLPQKRTQDKVVVFIRPPTLEFEHNVTLSGEGAELPKTLIYVQAPEHKHTVAVQDNTALPKSAKPTVYYLKKASLGAEAEVQKQQNGYGDNTPQPQPQALPEWGNKQNGNGNGDSARPSYDTPEAAFSYNRASVVRGAPSPYFNRQQYNSNGRRFL